MKHPLQSATLALATFGTFVLAACGGGSSGSAPQAVPAAVATAPSSGSSTQSGSTEKVTLTVAIPQPPSKASAAARRAPQYVSASTHSLTITDNTTGSTGSATCSGSCTSLSASIQAPVGSSTITAYLKDASSTPRLLSQLVNYPINVTAGQANNISVTFDAVLYQWSSNPPTVVYGTGSSGTITLYPYDIDGNYITSGNLVDNADNVIVSANGATQSIVAADASDFTISTLTWNPGSYTLTGTLNYDGTGSAYENLPLTSSATSESFGSVYVGPNPVLNITDQIYGTAYRVTNDQSYTSAAPVYDIEVASTSSPATVSLTVTDYLGASAMVGVQSDGCSGSFDFINGTGLSGFTWPGTGTTGTLSFTTNTSIAGTCQFVLTDENSNTATVYLAVNNPSITIQGRKRQ